MPELPEVETVKTLLKPLFVSKTIVDVNVLYSKMILSPLNEFQELLKGKVINDIKRKGKYLLFYLSDNYILISHLRMEGKFIELINDELSSPHGRVIFTLSDKMRIAYDDSRCFGIMKLIRECELDDEKLLNKLGPEPFDVVDFKHLLKRLNNNKPIKELLLDQSFMCGIGNIYADEILYESKIHPLTPCNKINLNTLKLIVENAKEILNHAIELGGSTVKSYHALKGVDGRFQNEIKVYGREGKPCMRCSYTLKKIFLSSRGTTFCPVCQKQHFDTKVIAIVGKIASGKSTALNYFTSLGYNTISSDNIVSKLYKDDEVINKLKKHFKKCFVNDELRKDLLRLTICDNSNKKQLLEKIIHPLVEKELINFIKSSHTPYTFIEVPLLFSAHMDYLADYIIGIDVNYQTQVNHLKIRNVLNIDSYLKLNANNQFDENKDKMIIINNDSDLSSFYHKLSHCFDKIKRDNKR